MFNGLRRRAVASTRCDDPDSYAITPIERVSSVQFHQDVADVSLRGRRAHMERARELLVRFPFRYQCEYFSFAFGQAVDLFRGAGRLDLMRGEI